jgi:hypothetical protein
VEFQFYVPAVALPLGVALGYHIINRRRFLSPAGFQQAGHIDK